ncbi:thymopoietin a isoform X1 [Coregonus clupeaformis]|uniref:thymopoietin a isoform X1 n=1 Tax=Coregonus clupeaformis TaxID=59861 RepID=UPI001E1C7BCA|nr:thymopoietin a isoform X1 [Coregonus clupeaformis]
MPEYLEDPSVLTKDKLKSELLANNVALPTGDQRKDVYVQLYLKNLTVQNKKIPSTDAFSSDEELPVPVVSNKSRSGRKATRKTDKPRPEDLDVTKLTSEGLKDELLKYGVNVGPIVATTRKLYERRLQKLLDHGPPETVTLPMVITQVDSNHNGNSNSDRYSDKEEEVTTVPEPEPVTVPVVERPVRSRGKTPVTTRTRSSQHNRLCCEEDGGLPLTLTTKAPSHEPTSLLNTALMEEPAPSVHAPVGQSIRPLKQWPLGVLQEVCPLLVAKPSSLPRLSGSDPFASFTVRPVSYVSHTPSSPSPQVLKEQLESLSSLSAKFDMLSNRFTRVEKIAAGEQTPSRVDEKDVLKEMFPYETNTPTGINATCRRPIRGAAGRPLKSGDLWTDETLLRSTSNSSYSESRTATVHRVTTLPPSTRLVTSVTPPAGKAVAPPRGLPFWLKLLLLSVVAGFIFFVYQTMETNAMAPFGGSSDSTQTSDS